MNILHNMDDDCSVVSFYQFLEPNDFEALVCLDKKSKESQLPKIQKFILTLLAPDCSCLGEREVRSIRERVGVSTNLKELKATVRQIFVEAIVRSLFPNSLQSMGFDERQMIAEIFLRQGPIGEDANVTFLESPFLRPFLLNSSMIRSTYDSSLIGTLPIGHHPARDNDDTISFLKQGIWLLLTMSGSSANEKREKILFNLLEDPDTKFYASRAIERCVKRVLDSTGDNLPLFISDQGLMKLSVELLSKMSSDCRYKTAIYLISFSCQRYLEPRAFSDQESYVDRRARLFSYMQDIVNSLNPHEKEVVAQNILYFLRQYYCHHLMLHPPVMGGFYKILVLCLSSIDDKNVEARQDFVERLTDFFLLLRNSNTSSKLYTQFIQNLPLSHQEMRKICQSLERCDAQDKERQLQVEIQREIHRLQSEDEGSFFWKSVNEGISSTLGAAYVDSLRKIRAKRNLG